MADIAVDFAVQLLGLALEEINLQRGVRDDVKWLHRELQRMRCFLLDAQRRSLSGDEAVKNWVREITDAAYEAEDIAAKFERREQRCNERRGCMVFLQRYGFPSKELHDIANDVKSLRETIEGIRDSRATYGFSSIDSNVGCSSNNLVHELRRRPLFQDDEHVIGFQNDKKRVMELLRAKDSRCYVIGIVGMGGMGKSTLARQVFKGVDRREFPMTAWVDLSQNYIQNHHDANPIHNLLIEIAKHVMPDSPDLPRKRTDELSEVVKTKLRDGRYLIVMDDVWETEVWDLVKEHLPDEKNGSRIIITTRNENVAEHPALHFPPHRMEGLDDKKSWDLFTRVVFEDEEQIRRECIGELKGLAEELVHGCRGSPLALTVLGGLLAGKEKTSSAWQGVLGNRKWLRGDVGSNCLDILRLSYRNLPHHLKLCFLYLSAYPEDHNIHVEKLIRLWVAEGFVAKIGLNDEETEEDIARTYLEGLKQRCFVRIFRSPPSTKLSDCYEYCRIHDFVRELSVMEAKEANFMNLEIKDGGNRAIHRLSLQKEFSPGTWLDRDDKILSLRTLLNFTEVRITNFKHLNLLRVLDLEGARIDQLPEEVGDMILLRYLSIKDTCCKFLPNSICKLSHLETLDCDFQHRSAVGVEIPDDVWKMKTLKHILGVNVDRKVDFSHLIKLQTLLWVVKTPGTLHSLYCLTHLRVLSLGAFQKIPMPLPMDIWRALQSWPYLKFLALRGFDMKDAVCDRHGFLRLQRLYMIAIHFDSWEVEKDSMPSLEVLDMENCEGLKRLPNGVAHCKKLGTVRCKEMDDEFVKWYRKGREDGTLEFHYVNTIDITQRWDSFRLAVLVAKTAHMLRRGV